MASAFEALKSRAQSLNRPWGTMDDSRAGE